MRERTKKNINQRTQRKSEGGGVQRVVLQKNSVPPCRGQRSICQRRREGLKGDALEWSASADLCKMAQRKKRKYLTYYKRYLPNNREGEAGKGVDRSTLPMVSGKLYSIQRGEPLGGGGPKKQLKRARGAKSRDTC